jgi:Family of unknown function (DUF6282)
VHLLDEAVDTHVHSAPGLIPRKLDDIALAQAALAAGMAAIVLKNHFFTTTLRADSSNRTCLAFASSVRSS